VCARDASLAGITAGSTDLKVDDRSHEPEGKRQTRKEVAVVNQPVGSAGNECAQSTKSEPALLADDAVNSADEHHGVGCGYAKAHYTEPKPEVEDNIVRVRGEPLRPGFGQHVSR